MKERCNELVFVPNADDVSQSVRDLTRDRQTFAVTDTNVARLHPEILPKENLYVVEAGEDSKTLAYAEKICKAMLDCGMTRGAVVVAYGGGVIGDLAGFAASVYMRGVDFINVPTTLLAQVDSAIGGKTAVDLDGYKNMIGSFKMPLSVVICPELLATLPVREWRCGMGELVKTAFLDSELFAYVTENIDSLNARDKKCVEKAVTVAANFKKKITDEDPTEKGLRKILNLGHTVGHALEKCDDHKLSHGEYVTLGMKIEFEMLRAVAGADGATTNNSDANKEFFASANSLLDKVGAPTLPDFSADEVVAAAKTDKKNRNGKISIIGLTAAGKTYESELTANEFGERYDCAVGKIKGGGCGK